MNEKNRIEIILDSQELYIKFFNAMIGSLQQSEIFSLYMSLLTEGSALFEFLNPNITSNLVNSFIQKTGLSLLNFLIDEQRGLTINKDNFCNIARYILMDLYFKMLGIKHEVFNGGLVTGMNVVSINTMYIIISVEYFN